MAKMRTVANMFNSIYPTTLPTRESQRPSLRPQPRQVTDPSPPTAIVIEYEAEVLPHHVLDQHTGFPACRRCTAGAAPREVE